MIENKPSEETTVEESNEELSSLRDALQNAVDGGDMDKADELKKEILPHLAALKEAIYYVSPGEAREIMGKEYFGPEELEKAFGQPAGFEKAPHIPFSKEELEMAKKMGQFLILRADKTADGMTLKTYNLYHGLRNSLPDGERENHPDHIPISGNENFDLEMPEKGWALVSKEVIPESKNNCYIVQTNALFSQLVQSRMAGLTDAQKKAYKVMKEQSPVIINLGSSSREEEVLEALKMMENLEINKMLRPSVSEVFYDMFVHLRNTGEHLYKGEEIWTRTRKSQEGSFLTIENKTPISLLSPWPKYRNGSLGAVYSRRS